MQKVFGYPGNGINGVLAGWAADVRAGSPFQLWRSSGRPTGRSHRTRVRADEGRPLALARGDTDRLGVIKKGLMTKAQEFLSGKGR